MRSFVFVGLFLACYFQVFGQKPSIQDSIERRLRLLTELSRSGNFERAQLEAEDFRWFVRRERAMTPPKAVVLLSSIYRTNKDEKSALRMLDEVELDVRRERDLLKKSELLTTLIKEYEAWETPEKALACQRMLSVTQDSLTQMKASIESQRWRRQFDSLQVVRKAEMEAKDNIVELEKDRAYTIVGIALLVFLALLAANFITSDRWRKRLENKELEMDLIRSARPEADILPPPVELPTTRQTNYPEAVIPEKKAALQNPDLAPPFQPAWFSGEEEVQKIALIIEPNRQIVLYLKSLLSDHFEVETATTANEGLQMATDLLPDIIVCDAVLNGKTGIDVVRQIKMAERTNHIPVILLTDKTGNDGMLDATRAGAETWFNRPLLDVEMEMQVKKLMGMRKIRQDQFGRALHLYFTDNRVESGSPFLADTLAMIEQNLPNPDFTAEELARKMQMTKYQFFRKLKLLTGKEPAQLIREMRLEKAKMLLEKRAAPVQTIAELVGFTNSGTFSLAFKDYFGENTLLLQQGRYLN